MTLPFTFPVSLGVFVAYQEQLINRPLTEDERKITAVWLDIINQADPEDTKIIDQLIAQHPGKDGMKHFLESVKMWMELRFQCGQPQTVCSGLRKEAEYVS